LTSRVFLLGELVLLLYADYAVLYGKSKDVGVAFSQLPRVAAAAALVWAILFFAADVGWGGPAATFGGLIILAFFLRFYAAIITSIESFTRGY
jgi:hypothetical protein